MTEETIPTAKGQCLCGAVQITVSELKPLVDVCHCDMCRKWCGGPFFGVSGASHEVAGEANVTVFRSSEWAERAACDKCGSSLWYRFLPTGHTSFLAGLFDLPDTAEIEQQIFIDEKPCFYDFAQKTPMKTGAQIVAEAEASGLSFD